MKVRTTWSEKMHFDAAAGGHSVSMDTTPPMGADTGMSPKQLLLAAICGCTGMDVVALLKKFKQPLSKFEIEAESELSEGAHPIVFKKVELRFKLEGEMDEVKVRDAIHLSQTKYCGVTAMVSKAVPIHYSIELNAKIIGDGKAEFSF